MGDNPLSPTAASPRKLPIPSPGVSANTNSALKGILIKPKRILPSQPDNQKLKRSVDESNCECNTEEYTRPQAGLFAQSHNPASTSDGSAVISGLPSHKVTVPKLHIDVDRLKTFFQLQGNAVVRRDKQFKKDLNENDIDGANERATDRQVPKDRHLPVRSHSGCTPSLTQPILSKDNTFYSSTSKVKEWCSARDAGKTTTKMASDHSVTRTLERNIRSPSPKSNTTWDRSSSGYSSDERADPRSPPPSHSASASVSSKTETEATDDVSVSQNADVTDDKTDVEDDNEQSNDPDTLTFQDDVISENLVSNSVDDLLTSANDCSAVTLTPTPVGVDADITGAQCENCDTINNPGADRNDTTSSCVNFSFDNSNSVGLRPPPNTRRPVWTALSNPPGNGRIQYRKSVSESVISLRHPSRQGAGENNFDGLEVCGKSFPQTSFTTAIPNKLDASVQDAGAKSDAGNRPEILSPTSAFTRLERPVVIVDSAADTNNGQELNARARSFRQPLTTCRSPRDFKTPGIGLSLNAKLALRDDKDIRKTLHDLSSPRRPSPGGKIVPIRARHTIHVTSATSSQPINTIDTISAQPIPTQVATLPRTSVSFGKKMWRAPNGQPENAQMRPFSPFGGTMPPAKIKEQEKKKHSDEFD